MFLKVGPIPWVIAVAHVGWPGVQRVWYLRAFRGRSVSPTGSVRVWRAFFWRFAALGLVAAVPFVVIIGVVRPNVDAPPSWFAIAAISVLVDFLLTFVTPALSFSTRRIREALRIGVKMIVEEWPACAVYVVAPPLALEAVFGFHVVASLDVTSSRALSAITVLMGLVFKGATAAFYLRRHPCGDEGSAWEARPLPIK